LTKNKKFAILRKIKNKKGGGKMDEIERVWNPEVKLISITPNAEKLIEKAYRNCYQSKLAETPEERRNFIRKCIQRGHLSPLEFGEAAFEIVGSRVFTHQLVRH
jgi:thymidylate synthase ThyX